MRDDNLGSKRDLPIDKLVPCSKRTTSRNYCRRVEASLRTVGLIEPLIVRAQGDCYEILDGHLRHEILQKMGVGTVPCIVYQTPPTNQDQTYE